MSEGSSGVYVRDAAMDVHLDRFAIEHEDLLEQHSGNPASFNIGVWHEVPLWPIRPGPTKTETLLFSGPALYEDVTRPRNFRFDSTSERLSVKVNKYEIRKCN